MRLIDADALEESGWWLIRDNRNQSITQTYETKAIDSVSTVDAVSVVHSWWEISEHNNSLIPCVGYKCHNCGSTYARIDTQKKEYNYCPNCGAHMDGRRENSLHQSLKKGLEEAIAYENGEVELRTERREDSDV